MNTKPTLHHLSNGIPVILDMMDMATTQVSVYIKSGSRDEAPHEHGITHFTEHAICMGTPSHTSLQKIMDHVAENAGMLSAETSKKYISVWGRILAENFDTLIETIADQLKNSVFDNDVLKNEQRTILDEHRRGANNFNKFIYSQIFTDSGLAHDILGTPDTIQSFTANQVREYLGRILSAQNIIICVTGRIENTDTLIQKLEKLFSWIPSFNVSHMLSTTQTCTIAHDEKNDYKNVKICIAFKNHIPTTLETRRQNLAQIKFKSILKNRLMQSLRIDNGLVYSVNTSKIGDEYESANVIITETAPANIASVIAKIAQTCRDIITTHPVTDNDVHRIKMKSKFEYANRSESIDVRHRTQLDFFHKFGTLYDIMDDMTANDTITKTEIMDTTRDFFTSPISIITQGPKYDGTLTEIWNKNFTTTVTE